MLHTSPDFNLLLVAGNSGRILKIFIPACFSSYCRIYSRGIAVTIVTTLLWLPKRQGRFLFSEFSSRSAPSLLFNGFRGLATGGGESNTTEAW